MLCGLELVGKRVKRNVHDKSLTKGRTGHTMQHCVQHCVQLRVVGWTHGAIVA